MRPGGEGVTGLGELAIRGDLAIHLAARPRRTIPAASGIPRLTEFRFCSGKIGLGSQLGH